MSKKQRDIGLRFERKVVNLARDAGHDTYRVPLSGAAEGFWAFVLNGQQIILITTAHLKLLARESVKNGKTAKGGDDKASLGALVKLDDLMVVK